MGLDSLKEENKKLKEVKNNDALKEENKKLKLKKSISRLDWASSQEASIFKVSY